MPDDEDIVIEHWGEYLAAFERMFTEWRDEDAVAQAQAHMEMVIEASPDYWRAMAKHRQRHRARQESGRRGGLVAQARRRARRREAREAA